VNHLPIPAAQDIVRIVASSADETERRLTEYYTEAGAAFNYSLSQRLSSIVYSHSMPLAHALSACQLEPTRQGAKQNAKVIELIWDAGNDRTIIPYKLQAKTFRIRRDLGIRVAPPFYFVENGSPQVFWLQPRKTHSPSGTQFGLLAAIIRSTFLVDDFAELGLEILDLSSFTGTKFRQTRILRIEDLVLPSPNDVQAAMQLFANAYDRVKSKGVEKKRRTSKRPPMHPDFFDPV
jgi:hypothetical protein